MGLISLDLKAFLNLKNSNSMYKTHPDVETKFGGKTSVLNTGIYGTTIRSPIKNNFAKRFGAS